MRDSLEQFVSDNRDDFDKAVPNLKIWAEIDKSLRSQPKKLIFTRRFFSIAASLVLLVGVSIAIGWSLGQKSGIGASLASVSPEFTEMEDFYQRKLTAVRTLVPASSIDPTIQADLDQLENVLEELQTEYKKAPQSSREQIIRAMMTTYQSKLKILERILNNNNQQPSSHSTNQQHETVI